MFIPFAHFDSCTQTWFIMFTNGGEKHFFDIGYSITAILYFIISVLVVIIFVVTVKRSRLHLQRQHGNEAESLLLTNNKSKILSKQFIATSRAYPIINTLIAMVFVPLFVFHSSKTNLISFISSSGLVTCIIAIIHPSILKCQKKRRERLRKKLTKTSQVAFCNVPNHHNDVFTRETVASTNAHTTYKFTCTSSFSCQLTKIYSLSFNILIIIDES